MSLWRYRERLPVEPLVTMGEGDTPLMPAPHAVRADAAARSG